jgi:pyruvate/2-oxoglutarate dehydrogenase complex dihydrolipoamide dehydrogenase (E3) component
VGVAKPYDLVIIGLGSAGLTAVRVAAGELGLRVAAVERDRVGGDCLWSGCVPSKSVLASARTADIVANAPHLGIPAPPTPADRRAVWGRMATVRAEIAATDDNADVVRALGADVYVGTARVTGARSVAVDGPEGSTELDCRFILVCTGSRATIPPIQGLSDVAVLTNETLFSLDCPPDSIAIVGAGPVGVETAQALNRLGADVDLIDGAARILTREEPEAADRLARILEREGVRIHLGSAVTALRKGRDGVTVEIGDGDDAISAGSVMVATGRTANVDGLGLDRLGIVASAAGIAVDARSRTIVPNVYAVGDVAAGRSHHTHSAATDAALAVRDMFLPGRAAAVSLVPWCIFTDPELAHVGLTAAEARERFGDRQVRVHRQEMEAVDRARIERRTDGVMTVVTARGRIVGAHILAPHAGEMIHELALAVRFSMSISELARVPHVYPTYGTAVSQLVATNEFRRVRRLRGLARLSRWTG